MFLWPDEISHPLSALQEDPVDDFVDRLNYVHTVFLLIFFAALIGTKQHFGSPIQCMTPARFPGTWASYAHDYCFVSNTYSSNVTTPITNGIAGTATKQEIVYYQWVPYVLVIQAFTLLLPRIFWNFITSFHGLEIRTIVEETMKLRSVKNSSDRTSQLTKIASFAVEYLEYSQTRRILKLLFGGCFFTAFYIFVKWLFVLVTVAQVLLVGAVVGDGSFLWGYHMIWGYALGHTWRTTGIFPRVTFCDFTIAHLAQMNTYSVQCVLMINVLNEKVFLLLWLWIAMLAVVDLTSAFYTTLTFAFSCLRRSHVLQMLQVDSRLWEDDEKRSLSHFINDILKRDGVLLLWFVNNRAGGVIVRELAWQMWSFVDPRHRVSKTKMEQGWTSREKKGVIPAIGTCDRNNLISKSLNMNSKVPLQGREFRGPGKIQHFCR
uniref:Innexin n=1 Tax=Parascaris univalens TaxID=6257 RepID=A0A915C4E1_PARUN